MREERGVPFWLIGVIVALLLILIGQRMSGGGANPVLVQRFAPRPTDPNAPAPIDLPQVSLPSLPPQLQQTFSSLRDRLAGGQAIPALTPVASGVRVRVEIDEIRRIGDSVQVKGQIVNIADQPISIAADAFSFLDSAGISYTLGADGATVVPPGRSSPLDLSVPLPEGRGLTLTVNLPPDQPIRQTLIVETVP